MMRYALLFIIFLLFPTFARAQDCPVRITTPYQAVALYKNNLLNELETGNAAPQTDDIPVFDKPGGTIIAHLQITYARETGLTGVLVHEGKIYPYTPAVYDSDWGYGPWFHATILDFESPDWKLIALPEITSGWVELPGAESVAMTDFEQVYTYKGGNVLIIKSNENGLTFRDEQEADMWCEAGNPPPLKDFSIRLVPQAGFYDKGCNLLIAPTYTRGC
jgi:hypothetical protein